MDISQVVSQLLTMKLRLGWSKINEEWEGDFVSLSWKMDKG